MPYIPSITLENNLQKARFGVWVEQLQEGRVGLVCKIPESVIKALYRGARASLFVAVVGGGQFDILCLGLKVQDEPEHPFAVLLPSATSPEYAGIKDILRTRKTVLHCLNELDHPMLSAWCSLDDMAAQRVLDSLNASTPYLLDPDSQKFPKPSEMLHALNMALDRFQQIVHQRSRVADSRSLSEGSGIPLELDVWEPIEVFEVTPSLASGPFRIDDGDEGKKLERVLHIPVDRIYPGATYRSPTISRGSSRRELTDVIGFDDRWMCLVESKALSVLAVESARPSARRAATIMKDVKKGLKQLQGALNNIRSDTPIFNGDGQEITIPNRKKSPAHAILLLSEMYSFLDWKWIAAETSRLSENDEHKALFHVIDLAELNYIVTQSEGPDVFNKFMAQRWVQTKVSGTAYGRTMKLPEGFE